MRNGGTLDLVDVTKRFGGFTAVDRVSLTIRDGEFLTLLGPSGSGKTTLLMMIAGFHDLTSGEIRLDEASIAGLPPEKRNFGMVFQGYALFPHMTVRENVGYALDIRKRPKSEIAAKVDEMLDLVQLSDFGHRKPAQLSGGQQQRVALARALAFSPPVLLLDEPLGALDRKLRVEVQEQLKEIHRRVGTTFIYVTHDQEEALSMSDRIVIMREGGVEQVGAPVDLYERPRTAFAASFLGKSNFLRNGSGVLALRPEKIDMRPDNGGAARLAGTVRSVTYLGSARRIIVAPEDGADPLEVDIDNWRVRHAFEEGQRVLLDWDVAAAVELQDGGESRPRQEAV